MNPVYSVYGLRIQSDLALPELTPWNPHPAGGEAIPQATDYDVRVRFGSVPRSLEGGTDAGVLWQRSPGKYLLSIDGVARFLITAGQEVTIDADPGATEDDLRAFLLGSVCGVLLHTCGLLPLHASSIATSHGALVFMGRSGGGKSTLLSALLERGHTMIADDVTAVMHGSDGASLAYPGYPRVRLWDSALRAMGATPERLRRVRPSVQKYLLPTDRIAATPTSIAALFELVETNEDVIRVEELTPAEQLARCTRYVRATRLFPDAAVQRLRFEGLTAILRTARLRRVLRPAHPFQPHALADVIERLGT
jgi:hypothetical protein